MMKQKYQAYAAATQTVAKTRQIVLLYEGAVRYMQQAREAIQNRKYEDRYNLIIKAASIIDGLQACLDFEQGGDVARLLYNYYASIYTRMYAIHHSNSLESCDEIIADLKQMRDVWHEIDQSQSIEAAPANDIPPPSEVPVSEGGAQNITLSA